MLNPSWQDPELKEEDLKPGVTFFQWRGKIGYVITRVENGVVHAIALLSLNPPRVTRFEMPVEEFLRKHKEERRELNIPAFVVEGVDDMFEGAMQGWMAQQDSAMSAAIRQIDHDVYP